MAKPAATTTIEDDRFYLVTLKRPVAYKGRTLSPMANHRVKGAVLKLIPQEAIKDAVVAADLA